MIFTETYLDFEVSEDHAGVDLELFFSSNLLSSIGTSHEIGPEFDPLRRSRFFDEFVEIRIGRILVRRFFGPRQPADVDDLVGVNLEIKETNKCFETFLLLYRFTTTINCILKSTSYQSDNKQVFSNSKREDY